MYILDNIICGGITMDKMIPDIVHTVINLIKIVVPILLVIFGMLDLGKAVMAQKDDEIKKGQQTFFKRLLSAVIVFFVVVVVQLVVGLVAKNDTAVTSCLECFVNGNCQEVDNPYGK